MLNMFRMLIHPSSGACDLFVELFHGLYCSGSMCVGVTLWFGCGGVNFSVNLSTRSRDVSSARADERTDMTKPLVSFRNLTNASKNGQIKNYTHSDSIQKLTVLHERQIFF